MRKEEQLARCSVLPLLALLFLAPLASRRHCALLPCSHNTFIEEEENGGSRTAHSSFRLAAAIFSPKAGEGVCLSIQAACADN